MGGVDGAPACFGGSLDELKAMALPAAREPGRRQTRKTTPIQRPWASAGHVLGVGAGLGPAARHSCLVPSFARTSPLVPRSPGRVHPGVTLIVNTYKSRVYVEAYIEGGEGGSTRCTTKGRRSSAPWATPSSLSLIHI